MGNEIVKKENLDKIAAVGGAALGIGAASAIGTAMTGVSALGFTLAATTPVGWLALGALAGGAILFGGSKVVSLKGESFGKAKALDSLLEDEQKKKYNDILTKISNATSRNKTVIDLLTKSLNDGLIDNDLYNEYVQGVNAGSLIASDVVELLSELSGNDYSKIFADNQFDSAAIVLIMAVGYCMIVSDGYEDKSEIETMYRFLNKLIPTLVYEDFDYLYSIIKKLYIEKYFNSPMQIIARLAIIFSDAVAMHRVILGLIKAIAMADGKMDSAESALLNNAIKAFRTISKLKYYECILENIDISNGNVFTSNLDNKKFYKKAINVISSYAHWLEPEQIIAIYDATIFGKADKGAILTKLGVQVSHSKKFYYYSELTKEVIYNEICFFTKELDDILLIFSKNSQNILENKLPQKDLSIASNIEKKGLTQTVNSQTADVQQQKIINYANKDDIAHITNSLIRISKQISETNKFYNVEMKHNIDASQKIILSNTHKLITELYGKIKSKDDILNNMLISNKMELAEQLSTVDKLLNSYKVESKEQYVQLSNRLSSVSQEMSANIFKVLETQQQQSTMMESYFLKSRKKQKLFNIGIMIFIIFIILLQFMILSAIGQVSNVDI